MGRILLVTGTGTSIGKTHVGQAVLHAAAPLGRVLGFKPVESGVDAGVGEDEARLAAASTFHVKPSPEILRLRQPVSPHLAARNEGATIDPEAILREVARLAAASDLLLLELPGGLFSPLTETLLNADLALRVEATRILVAPNRLGVLHDVGAATRAAALVGLELHGVVLSAPPEPDASTDSNAEELARVTSLPLLASVPRAAPAEIARTGGVDRVLDLVR